MSLSFADSHVNMKPRQIIITEQTIAPAMTQDPSQTTNDIAIALNHCNDMLKHRRPDLAEQQCREVLAIYPNDISTLTTLATALRLQQRYQEAIKLLLPAIAQTDDVASARQELGLCYAAMGDNDHAQIQLQRAVSLDPSLALSWRMLGDIYLAQEKTELAEAAFQQHLKNSSQDPELIASIELLNQKKVALAEQKCRSYLKRQPTDVNAIRLLAEIAIQLKVYDDAEHLLQRCLELAPDFHLARFNYANALSGRQKPLEALSQLDILEQRDPGKPSHMMLKASVLTQIGKYPEAIALFEKLLEDFSPQANTLMGYGHALKTIGRQQEAITAYQKAIEKRADLGDAYWSLANLKTFSFSDQHIDAMKAMVASGQCNRDDFFHLCFALGKALEDRKHYDLAFSYYAKGNSVKKKQERYRFEQNHRIIQRTQASCQRELFDNNRGSGNQATDPIFIVGLPRSGSTLLEQILSSHSQVDGTKELPDIIAMTRRIGAPAEKNTPPLYPAILHELSQQQLQELGDEYLARAKVQRGQAPFFIDKMPNNFFHIGFIQLILPNAKIIDARRHPMDACFSGYKQLFASGQRFSYGLTDIGLYYQHYLELMDHWDQVLPDKVLKVQYEDVIADTEQQVRRILDYCGLEFEAACLNFHQNKRAVRTASSEQVRQPINKKGLDQWRPFEAHLDELKTALGPALQRYPI